MAFRDVLQAGAKMGAVFVGGCGVAKLAHEQTMMREFYSFGYPRGFEYAVGALEVACMTGCVFKTRWGAPLLLFTLGGGVYSVSRRALLPETPELCRKVELGCCAVEITGVSFIAHFCSPYRGVSPMSLRYDIATVLAGAATGYGVHTATGTAPYWVEWGQEAKDFVGWCQKQYEARAA